MLIKICGLAVLAALVAAAADVVTVADGGQAIHQLKPRYPKRVQKAGIAGTVVVEVRVKGAEVIRGPERLRAPALAAVKQWRWTPTMLHGKPVERVAEVWCWYVLKRRVR
jgi:protein TonB